MLSMIHASNKVVFTQEKQYSLPVHRQNRGICFCFKFDVYNHSYGSSVAVIMAFCPCWWNLADLRRGQGPNPFSVDLACAPSLDGRSPVKQMPPPSCADYLHCSNGISSHTDCKPVSLQDWIVHRQDPVPFPHCQTKRERVWLVRLLWTRGNYRLCSVWFGPNHKHDNFYAFSSRLALKKRKYNPQK